MSSSGDIPPGPMIPMLHKSVPARADWREKLQSGRVRQSIPRFPRDCPAPLSFAQERVWLLQHMEPGSPTFNRPLSLRLSGPLDEAALRRALQSIVDRHEILRTRYISRDGQALPVISNGHTLPIPLIDLTETDQRLEHAGHLAKEDSLRPFDL